MNLSHIDKKISECQNKIEHYRILETQLKFIREMSLHGTDNEKKVLNSLLDVINKSYEIKAKEL